MLKHLKVVLTAAVALVALAAAVGTASASEATVSPAGSISSPSSGNLTFTAGFSTISCPVTLNGTLAAGPIRTERAGEHLGSISEVRIANERCSGGTVRSVSNLPWEMNQIATLGTTPNAATGVSYEIRRSTFLLTGFFEIECSYEGTSAGLMSYATTRTSGVYTSSTSRSLEEHTLATTTTGCPSPGTMRGSFTTSPTQTITMR